MNNYKTRFFTSKNKNNATISFQNIIKFKINNEVNGDKNVNILEIKHIPDNLWFREYKKIKLLSSKKGIKRKTFHHKLQGTKKNL